MRTHASRRRRAGLSLMELIVALVLMVIVLGLAVPFFTVQARSIGMTAGRMDALQNARYAQNAIDRDLRIAGIGVVDRQPLLVQAHPYAITFNADLVTRDTADPGAIYFDADIDTMATTSLITGRAVTLPLSAVTYPDTNYMAGSIPSRAETISYWVELDASTPEPNDYILWRRANDTPQRLVTKGLILPSGQAFFRYFKPGAGGVLDSIPNASLPYYHTAAIHGGPADSAGSAQTDSIRVVRIFAYGMFKDPRTGQVVQRKVQSSTNLLNAGMLNRSTCGDTPIPPSAVTADTIQNGLGQVTSVRLGWTASTDQDGGEKDVERYALFKRPFGAGVWGEPFMSVGAGTPTYSFDDTGIASGSWEYGVLAQDCSPANSSMVSAPTVTIP
jgi:hypothetical protein